MKKLLKIIFFITIFISGNVFSATSDIPHPAGNIPPNPDYKKNYSSISDSEQKAISAINNARTAEGVKNITIPDNWSSISTKEQIFYLINEERADRGLAKLRAREKNLEEINQSFANNVSSSGLYSSNVHTDPVTKKTLTQRINSNANTNLKYAFIAEILAINIHPLGAIYEWMYNDAGDWNWAHRDTILGKYLNDQTYIGIGFADNYKGDTTQKVISVDFFHPASTFSANIEQRQADLENKIFGESVVLYSDLNNSGVSCRVPKDTTINSLSSNIPNCPATNYNDKISSIKIPHQQCVEFWTDSNKTGEKMTFCNLQKNNMPLNLNFVDQVIDKLASFDNNFSSMRTYSQSKLDNSKVFFFVDTNGMGYASPVSVGSNISDARDRNLFSLGNDNISSFTLPAGVCVELFQHINYEGKKRVYCNTSNERNFVYFWAGQYENDQLSSVKIYTTNKNNTISTDKSVQFWQHNDKTGNTAIFTSPANFSDARQTDIFPVGNDDISSFEIPPRTCVDVFQHINYEGFKFTYCNFQTTERLFVPLIGGFKENDNLSSVKMREISSNERF
ncbi:MAG: hypothetical protein Fur0024_1040 [Patescibacteria group bacterium]